MTIRDEKIRSSKSADGQKIKSGVPDQVVQDAKEESQDPLDGPHYMGPHCGGYCYE